MVNNSQIENEIELLKTELFRFKSVDKLQRTVRFEFWTWTDFLGQMRLYNCTQIKIWDVMDSYQKLNIKWFIFSISVAENK